MGKVNEKTGRGMAEKYRFGALTRSPTKWFKTATKVKAPTFACNISRGFFKIVAARPAVCA